MNEIKPGLKGIVEEVVAERHATAHMGDGSVAVLATPMMIWMMEKASDNAVAPHLLPTQGTVGTLVCVKHLAATPIGMKVRAEAELVEVDRRRLKFKVTAYDENEKIGERKQERFMRDMERFGEGLRKKVNR